MTAKRYTISTKINEYENGELNKLAEKENLSVSAILKLFTDALLNGEVLLEKGEIKTCDGKTFPDRFDLIEDEPAYDYEYLRVDRLLKKLEEKGYPLREYIDMAINQAESLPKYKGKGRRFADDWC